LEPKGGTANGGEREKRRRAGKLEGEEETMRTTITFLALLAVCLFASPALAEEGAGVAGASGGLIALGAGIGMGLAAFGVGLGQGRATAAAMESIGRNPNSADRLFTPFILGLALMEALALYTLVIAFILQGKIG
jgi:F-type H+-transporting ATPase subunit c